jgi:hypothetical protein
VTYANAIREAEKPRINTALVQKIIQQPGE